MKELSVEEKAKRYDSMFERLKEMYNNNKTNVADRLIYERYFPELKESENKRMIQYFKDLAPFDKADELYEKYGFSHKDAIAWLEKQGEHAKFRDSIQVGDKVTRNQDGVLVNLSQLNRVAKKDKKQGEEKPADKIEPKFKVDDVIRLKGSSAEYTIKRVTDTTYYTDGWSCGIERCEEDYELIEQKPAWSEEDEENRKNILYILNQLKGTAIYKEDKTAENCIDWLKSLKDRVQPQKTWKPSEEQMEALDDFIYAKYPNVEKHGAAVKSLYQDLKKLREE